MKDLSLLDGWLPAALTVLACLAVAALTFMPPTWRWLKRSLITLALCAGLVFALDYVIEDVWRPFNDELEPSVLFWSWIGLSGVALALVHLPSLRWKGWIAALLAGVFALVGASVQVNAQYGYYTTVGKIVDRTRLSDLSGNKATGIAAPPGGFLSDVWTPTTAVPAKGTVSKVNIPSSAGFNARPAMVYLPPAYAMTPRPLLPVLVLMHGQPGGPEQWTDGGSLDEAMDRYAAAHKGLAPIVVMPDSLGSTTANTLCVDSSRGNAETYLARDVPAWIRSNLQVATDRTQWTAGGFSFGGTCSVQLAVRAPEVYGRFIDIAGEDQLQLGSVRIVIDTVFDGDEARYKEHNPLDIMAAKRFPDTVGRIVAGADDTNYTSQLKRVQAACIASGMQISWLELPGGHSWSVWRPALEQSIPWLAAHTSLVR